MTDLFTAVSLSVIDDLCNAGEVLASRMIDTYCGFASLVIPPLPSPQVYAFCTPPVR